MNAGNAVEEVSTLSKLINEYGPFIVILSIFLVLFIFIIYYIINQNKKYMESERARNNEIVNSILDTYLKKSVKENEKKYDEKDIVNIFVKLNKSLKNVCELTQKKTHSNRTAIYVFHNGTHASHGLPFFKMTCISEKVTKESNNNIMMADHSAMPLTLFDSIVSSLYNNGEYRILTDQTKEPADLIFLKGSRIKDSFFIPIYDTDDKIMGFIYNGYNTVDESRDIEKEKEFLIELAIAAKPVIEFSKFQERKSMEEEE